MWVIWRYVILIVTIGYHDVNDPFRRPRRKLRKALKRCEKEQTKVSTESETLRGQADRKRDEIRHALKPAEVPSPAPADGKKTEPMSVERKRRLLREINRIERKLTWLTNEEGVWSNKIADLDDMLAQLRLKAAAEPLEIDESMRVLFREIEEKVDKIKTFAADARERAEEVDYLRDADDSGELDALEQRILGVEAAPKIGEKKPAATKAADKVPAALERFVADKAKTAEPKPATAANSEAAPPTPAARQPDATTNEPPASARVEKRRLAERDDEAELDG